LTAFGVLQEGDAKQLDEVRLVRKKYFHLWSGDASKMQPDALRCFGSIISVAKNILKIEVVDGKISINPVMQEYLRKQNVKPGA